MSEAGTNELPMADRIRAAHALYGRMTGMVLRLDPMRERMWFDWFKAGYGRAELVAVIAYLQREIRMRKRNAGALKLSNLLQLDRFEEDLAMGRVKLRAPAETLPVAPVAVVEENKLSAEEVEAGKRAALDELRRIKDNL